MILLKVLLLFYILNCFQVVGNRLNINVGHNFNVKYLVCKLNKSKSGLL